MKKLMFLTAFMAIAAFTFAQKPVKGSATKAKTLMESGDLAAAKTEIDNAIAYETWKLESKGKPVEIKAVTTYNKALVYAAIAASDDEALKSGGENPVKVAAEAYNKVLETEKEGSIYHTFATQKKQELYGNLFNKAVEYYNNEDMPNALTSFEMVAMVEPADTNAYQNALNIAYNLEKEEKVVEFGNKLIDLDFKKSYIYRMIAQYDIDRGRELDSNEKKEEAKPYYEKGLKVLEAGQTANPEDGDIAAMVVNLYITLDKTNEAITSLDKAISINPENKSLYLNKGLLLEKMGKGDEAVVNYRKATEVDPTYFDAWYSIGALYYNQGAEINKEMNNLEFDKYGRAKDKAKYDELDKQTKEKFGQALPAFEKSFEIKPEDQDVISILARIYNMLDRKEDYEKMAKLMKD